jgi:Cu(I)/Ag(I) efflux system membrane protein CusA/SilA
VDIQDIDLGTSQKAKEAIKAHLSSAGTTSSGPAGSSTWSGPERLVVIPITLVLVFMLYLSTGSPRCSYPLRRFITTIWLLYLLDYNLSVGVIVGFIALAGLDAETGVIMLLYLDISHDERQAAGHLKTDDDLKDAVMHGAVQRLRPKLMTILANIFGLFPVMWATGTGSEVAKRIAAPMVGGVTTSFLLELLIYPAICCCGSGTPI